MVYQMDPMGMLKTSYNYLWTSSRLRSKTSHKLKPEGTVNCLFLNLCQLLTSKLLRFCVSKNWAFEDFKQPPQFSGATPSPSQKEVFRFETFGQRGVNNVNDPHFLVEMIHAHMSLTYVLPSYHKSESFFWIGETRPWRNIILSNSFHFYLFDLPFLFGLSSAKNPADPRDPGRNKPELHTVLWNDFWLLNVSIDSVINWWVDHVPKKTVQGRWTPYWWDGHPLGNPEKTWVFLNPIQLWVDEWPSPIWKWWEIKPQHPGTFARAEYAPKRGPQLPTQRVQRSAPRSTGAGLCVERYGSRWDVVQWSVW